MWPTPHGFSKDGRSNGTSGNELGRAVNQAGRAFPTPTVAAAEGSSPKSLTRKDGRSRVEYVEICRTAERRILKP
jgi:hypothetical protein